MKGVLALMIFYSRQPVSLLQSNVILIEDSENLTGEAQEVSGYIVVSRSVYNTAVIFSDRFGDAPSLIERKISAKQHQKFVDYFAENAPSPLHMLAPFLHLADTEVKMEKDIKVLCGYLHIMSMAIDFNSYLSVPEEVRKGVEFTQGQLSTYKNSWEDLTLKLKFTEIDESTVAIDFLKSMTTSICQTIIEQTLPSLIQQTGQRIYPLADSIQEDSEENDVQEAILEDPWSALGTLLKDEIESASAAQEENASEEEEQEDTEEVELAEEEKKAAKEKEMMDSIIAMYGGV